jgi:hypothetical protein
VVASAVIGGLSEASGRSQRSCCASVPSASTGSAKKPLDVIRFPMPEQPWHSSSCTRQPVKTSVRPPPPTASGSMNDVRPIAAALCHRSHGVSVSASSTAAAAGRISRAAKSRQTRWISSCSGVSSITGGKRITS